MRTPSIPLASLILVFISKRKADSSSYVSMSFIYGKDRQPLTLCFHVSLLSLIHWCSYFFTQLWLSLNIAVLIRIKTQLENSFEDSSYNHESSTYYFEYYKSNDSLKKYSNSHKLWVRKVRECLFPHLTRITFIFKKRPKNNYLY